MLHQNPTGGAATDQKLEKLAPREKRALHEVATGKTDKEVADALGLQTNPVRNYLDHIFSKLGVHTRTQAAAFYLNETNNPGE